MWLTSTQHFDALSPPCYPVDKTSPGRGLAEKNSYFPKSPSYQNQTQSQRPAGPILCHNSIGRLPIQTCLTNPHRSRHRGLDHQILEESRYSDYMTTTPNENFTNVSVHSFQNGSPMTSSNDKRISNETSSPSPLSFLNSWLMRSQVDRQQPMMVISKYVFNPPMPMIPSDSPGRVAIAEFRNKVCPNVNRRCLAKKCGDSHVHSWPRRNPYLHMYIGQLCPYIIDRRSLFSSSCSSSSHTLGNPDAPYLSCPYGRSCFYSHTKEEAFHHPNYYKTKLCRSIQRYSENVVKTSDKRPLQMTSRQTRKDAIG
eukprot:GHVH01006431.1.p1 GENE.GHVH01006431.1~~GHVH01006431.1.p1  ORF type:complete len:311 (-),score=12.33 GHVH01006431.1:347-1279(-)